MIYYFSTLVTIWDARRVTKCGDAWTIRVRRLEKHMILHDFSLRWRQNNRQGPIILPEESGF